MVTRPKLVVPLVVWTLFVWGSWIRNVWGADDLSTGDQVLRTVIAAVFLGFAIAVGVRLWRGRGRSEHPSDRLLLGAFVVWTIGFWLVRGIGMIVDDHELGFTVVHTILMVISITLAGFASQLLPRRPAG